MQKKIYDGWDGGLYAFGEFEVFMNHQKGSERVRSEFSLGQLYQIWHLKGVTVYYTHNGNDMHPQVIVSLTGEDKSIGEVEKIILETAKPAKVK